MHKVYHELTAQIKNIATVHGTCVAIMDTLGPTKCPDYQDAIYDKASFGIIIIVWNFYPCF